MIRRQPLYGMLAGPTCGRKAPVVLPPWGAVSFVLVWPSEGRAQTQMKGANGVCFGAENSFTK